MKNLFFALLACLLMACFRAPQLTTLPAHSPAVPGSEVTAPLPLDRNVFVSAGEAAAGTAPRLAGAVDPPPAGHPGYAPAGGEPTPPVKASASRPVPLRRELRKPLRTVLLHKRPVGGRQDNPPPGESSLPTFSLVAGIIGMVGLIGSFVGSFLGLGVWAGVLFLLGVLGGLAAVITGGIAKGRIRRGLDAESGRGKATAGLILGIVNLGVLILLSALAIVLIIAWSGAGE